ncbi:MAG: TauD/TfdA family dioxygenase [Geminicoccaceae bacterium]
MTAKKAKVAFGSDMPIEELIFSTRAGAAIDDRTLEQMVDAYNTYGFFILDCPPRPDPREDLLAIAPFFGRVVTHNRSDHYGILAVNPEKKVDGFIDSTNQAHPPHTDGAFKDQPEKVITLQCVVPADSGGTSLLGSAKLAHDTLAAMDPDAASLLYDDEVMSIRRNDQTSTKAVFRREGERLSLCYRMDQAAKTHIKPLAQEGFRRLKAIIDDSLLRFDLAPHQILVIDNSSLVHGRDSFPQGADRRYHRLNFDGDGLLDLVHGFIPEITPASAPISAA